jgi:hypothetical protein
MPKPTKLASPFWVILLIFAVVRIVAGARGVPYEHPRIAAVSIVTLTFVAAALTAALARGLSGLSLKEAAKTGALMGLYAQVVIFTLTMISIGAGVETYFNYPAAINDELVGQTITFANALPPRIGGLVVGPITAAVAGMIGWAIGGVMSMNVGFGKKD